MGSPLPEASSCFTSSGHPGCELEMFHPSTPENGINEAAAASSTSINMRIRPVIEILTVIAVTGLLLEVAKASMCALVAGGVAAAVGLLGRSYR